MFSIKEDLEEKKNNLEVQKKERMFEFQKELEARKKAAEVMSELNIDPLRNDVAKEEIILRKIRTNYAQLQQFYENKLQKLENCIRTNRKKYSITIRKRKNAVKYYGEEIKTLQDQVIDMQILCRNSLQNKHTLRVMSKEREYQDTLEEYEIEEDEDEDEFFEDINEGTFDDDDDDNDDDDESDNQLLDEVIREEQNRYNNSRYTQQQQQNLLRPTTTRYKDTMNTLQRTEAQNERFNQKYQQYLELAKRRIREEDIEKRNNDEYHDERFGDYDNSVTSSLSRSPQGSRGKGKGNYNRQTYFQDKYGPYYTAPPTQTFYEKAKKLKQRELARSRARREKPPTMGQKIAQARVIENRKRQEKEHAQYMARIVEEEEEDEDLEEIKRRDGNYHRKILVNRRLLDGRLMAKIQKFYDGKQTNN